MESPSESLRPTSAGSHFVSKLLTEFHGPSDFESADHESSPQTDDESDDFEGDNDRYQSDDSLLTEEDDEEIVTKTSAILPNTSHISVNEVNQYVCEVCGKSFCKASRLRLHNQTHTGERPYKCTWDGCTRDFTRQAHLQRHLFQHEGLKPFACTVEGCSMAFVERNQLRKHLEVHNTPKPYKCTYEGCPESFAKHNQLRRHTCTHTQTLPYPCSQCEKTFEFPAFLKRHVERVHQKIKSNVCSVKNCFETFFTWHELQAHIKQDHPKQYACDLCHNTFANSRNLKLHKQTHSTERLAFVCDKCEKQFSTKWNLTQHVKVIHLKHQTFSCTEEGCKMSFGYKKCLERHLLTIHGITRSPKDIMPDPPAAVLASSSSSLDTLQQNLQIDHILQHPPSSDGMDADRFDYGYPSSDQHPQTQDDETSDSELISAVMPPAKRAKLSELEVTI